MGSIAFLLVLVIVAGICAVLIYRNRQRQVKLSEECWRELENSYERCMESIAELKATSARLARKTREEDHD